MRSQVWIPKYAAMIVHRIAKIQVLVSPSIRHESNESHCHFDLEMKSLPRVNRVNPPRAETTT